MGGQSIRQHMVLLCALLSDKRLERFAEERLVLLRAGAHKVEQQVGAGHCSCLPEMMSTATGERAILSNESWIARDSVCDSAPMQCQAAFLGQHGRKSHLPTHTRPMGWRLSLPFRPRGSKDRRLPGSQSALRGLRLRTLRSAPLRPRRASSRFVVPRQPECLRGSSPTASGLTDREPNTRGSRLPGGGFASRAVPPAGPALRFRSASQ